jgi:pimeloyl-ACP methyl ester carboxylesterase
VANQLPNPVIFVPGIMGSALRDQYPVSPETVWSPLKLLVKAYDRITLHPSDTRFELVEPARVVADQVFDLIYGEFIEELRHNLTSRADEPVPVYPFAYDWRQPLEQVEGLLADFIDEIIGRTRLLRHYHDAGFGTARYPAQVNLVGHSMGGLIIAGYLQKNGQKKVNRVATLATPFRGSLEAVAKTTIGVAALGASPGSSREREAARVTPALYYLLPSFHGAVEAADGLSDDLFLPESWQPSILETLSEFVRMYGVEPRNPNRQAHDLLKSMLDGAWRYRTRTERLQLENSKSWLAIAGVDAPTRLRMQVTKDNAGRPRFDLADADVRNEWTNANPAGRIFTGDNTVPYLGARSKFIPTEQMVCVSSSDFSIWEFKDRILESTGFHSAIPNMNLAQRLVVSHFLGRPFGDVWGRPAPDLESGKVWDPPIPGLPRR